MTPGGVNSNSDPAEYDTGSPSSLLAPQLADLALSKKEQLNIKAEDLEILHELGAGNGGTVSKVLHKPTNTIMARKVS